MSRLKVAVQFDLKRYKIWQVWINGQTSLFGEINGRSGLDQFHGGRYSINQNVCTQWDSDIVIFVAAWISRVGDFISGFLCIQFTASTMLMWSHLCKMSLNTKVHIGRVRRWQANSSCNHFISNVACRVNYLMPLGSSLRPRGRLAPEKRRHRGTRRASSDTIG